MLRLRARMLFRSIAPALVFVLAGCVGEDPVLVAEERSDSGADTVGADAIPETAIVASDSAEDSASDTLASDTGPIETGFPVIVVGKITGATGDEPKMIADGVTLVNATMKTSCFRDFVLSASWTETNGLTQAQIYDKLCSGPITVDVDMYMGSWYDNHVTHTVGYEKEPGVVHMNRYYVNTANMVADNLIHEAEGHSQGFRHDGVKATSVPYGLNDAFEACAP
ncbi:MAG: hypothetical protein ACXVEE_14170 [Polyangiales bacterium]